jgi:wyosine [tRNA(Phe)-imidazoG37] synthetase (radical SAM superfamily)
MGLKGGSSPRERMCHPAMRRCGRRRGALDRETAARESRPTSSACLQSLVFGPVPSRRLGQSLGVNNIPPKHCSYSCVYCQIGRTPHMAAERRRFFAPSDICDAVRRRLEECRRDRVRVDYLTLVPDGEPTLDAELGELLVQLRELELPVAVITNGSLLNRSDVRSELAAADWVSVKVDAISSRPWRLVDRPHGKLRLDGILEGLRVFAADDRGTLVTETMLVAGINDGEAEIEALAGFLSEIVPAIAYLAVPTRPPAESWVRPPETSRVVSAYVEMSNRLPRVELLIGEPLEEVAASSDVERDLLAITAVHPMDDSMVVELGGGSREALAVAADLVTCGRLEQVEYRGRRFFVRPFAASRARA